MSWFEKYQTYSHETSPKILEHSMVKYFNFTTLSNVEITTYYVSKLEKTVK